MVENLPTSAGDAREVGLIPGSGRFPGVEYGNPLQYSCLENSMDRGGLVGTVHGVTGSDTTKQLTLSLFSHTYVLFFFFFPTEHTYSHTLQKLLLGKIECLSLQMLPTCKLFFCFLSQCFILLIKRRKGTFFLHTVSTQIVYTLQV